ncbi:distal tail protein Dit [Virgibacillus litoralis]|uniref:Phage tail component-like protein n=1 Tax=Virgibacillus litoralis TaxID=578221 RepID=A0ABS4HHA0_9BACI|nr:distal tail protein Dit [Virgibacillus litoralis]MBP1950302.1 putative phage tail component-like protein [Virgibacillus litoralis]
MPLKSLTFNNIRKPWLHLLRGRSKPPFASISRDLLTVPGMDGAYLQSSSIQPLIINQPVGFTVRDDNHALQLKDELASWLVTDESVELQFDDEPGRIYYAVVQNSIDDFEKFAELRNGTIQFLCLDPYSYGSELTEDFLGNDVVTITNGGTAEADPIFELEVLAPITFAMVSDGEEYNLIGRPAKVDQEVIDTKTLLLEERGDTLSTWGATPTNVDGTVDGNLGTDGDGITVPSYGTNTPDWHGPALLKEITPAQDFEVEMHLEGRTTQEDQTVRIEFYAFDEGMNELGKMAVLDNSPNVHTKVAEARLGDRATGQYFMSSRNYEQRTEFWFGMVRMKRVGNKIEFYVTRIDNSSDHVDSLREVFVDRANNYGGRLQYIQIHIGKYGDTPRAYGPKINYIRATGLAQTTVDQTPYIAYAGDVIKFDHKNDELLINGEDRKDLKDFGAQYFKLAKGDNQIVMHPNNVFNTIARYRERFK